MGQPDLGMPLPGSSSVCQGPSFPSVLLLSDSVRIEVQGRPGGGGGKIRIREGGQIGRSNRQVLMGRLRT